MKGLFSSFSLKLYFLLFLHIFRIKSEVLMIKDIYLQPLIRSDSHNKLQNLRNDGVVVPITIGSCGLKTSLFHNNTGEMAEWSNAVVLKTIVLQGTGGSNPSLSAVQLEYQAITKFTRNFTRIKFYLMRFFMPSFANLDTPFNSLFFFGKFHELIRY